MMSSAAIGALALALVAVAVGPAQAQPPIPLWPAGAPGEKGDVGPETVTTPPGGRIVAGRTVMRITNVTRPAITVFRPERPNGAAIVVAPGGAYNLLAYDLEGTEICEWLNGLGVTGVLLKYRVPKREGLAPHAAALQDAQRAVSLVRHRAKEWGIDPGRVGMLGFSAGGHLSAVTSTTAGARAYTPVDGADRESSRPDVVLLVYPSRLTIAGTGGRLAPELAVAKSTPPTFLVQTQDDAERVENSLFYYLALQQAGVPAELHVYPTGGHGYGLRPTSDTVTTWPARAEAWLRARGFIPGR